MQAVIENALELYRRQRFLEETNRAFEALRADAEAWRAEEEERAAWDTTLPDDLHGPAGLVVLLPLTTVAKRIPLHVEVKPPGGGVKVTSFIKCEDIRSVARERLSHRWGKVSTATLGAVEDRLRILLGL
jgi:mRNA interferase MazF